MMKPGKPIHPTNAIGTAPDAATTPQGIQVSFDGGPNRNRQTTMYVIITNMEAAGGNTLEVSFANGNAWMAIATDTTITIPVVSHRCQLRGTTGAAADYAIMGIVA